MNKGLEALEKLTNYKCSRMSEKIECKEIIEKELKALEIIKAKLSPLAKSTFLPMTQEEFNLLNEVLNDEH